MSVAGGVSAARQARPATPARGQRLWFIDALKAVASQLIVWHHLAFYGPMSDWTYQLAPEVVTWFSQDARMAVQVFLVVAGFLAVRSLAPDGVLVARPLLALLWQRYVRVALPYLVALLLAVVCTELARVWMTHDSLSPPAELWQWVAHAVLIHGFVDVDSLSAGVWYVAVDFQLFALLLGLLWLGQCGGLTAPTQRRWGGACVLLALLASLLHFNRDPAWDDWALYFFGAYGLGVWTYWCSQPQAPAAQRAWLLAVWGVTLVALWLDFRARIALALAVSVLLAAAQWQGWLYTWPRSRVLAYLGQISYSVFLVHFPVALVVNALFTRFAPANALVQTGGVLLAWLLSNAVGMVFFHTVEQRLTTWGRTLGRLR